MSCESKLLTTPASNISLQKSSNSLFFSSSLEHMIYKNGLLLATFEDGFALGWYLHFSHKREVSCTEIFSTNRLLNHLFNQQSNRWGPWMCTLLLR
jgi:hypothetical protein